MKPANRFSQLLQSLLSWIGVTPWLLAVTALMFTMAAKARGDELSVPPELFAVTVKVNGCAATIVKPFQDAKGQWHWLAITADHCVKMNESVRVRMIWPESARDEFPGKVVYEDSRSDVAVVECHTTKPLPFVEIGEMPATGATVFTVGYPNGKLLGKASTVTNNRSTTRSITIRDDIWYGNSGGGLFESGKLVGVASARTGATGPSWFAGTDSVKSAYHASAVQLGFP